jgi:hypothetical protein
MAKKRKIYSNKTNLQMLNFLFHHILQIKDKDLQQPSNVHENYYSTVGELQCVSKALQLVHSSSLAY